MKTLLSPFGLALMTILCLGACQQEKATDGAQTGSDSTATEAPPQPIFTTIVNNLRMRDVPHLSGKTIEMIPAFTEVYSLERTAENVDTLMLRGVLYEEPWLQIEYKGKEGWVFGGGLREGKEQTVREKWDVKVKEEELPLKYEAFTELIGEKELDKLYPEDKKDLTSVFYYYSNMPASYKQSSKDINKVSVSFYEKDGKRVPHGPFYIGCSAPPIEIDYKGLMRHGKLKRLFMENMRGSYQQAYELRFNDQGVCFSFGKHEVFRDGTIHSALTYTDSNGEKQTYSLVEKYYDPVELKGDREVEMYYPHYDTFSSLF